MSILEDRRVTRAELQERRAGEVISQETASAERLERELDALEQSLAPPDEGELSPLEQLTQRIDHLEGVEKARHELADGSHEYFQRQRLLNALRVRLETRERHERELREQRDGTAARRDKYDERSRAIEAKMMAAFAKAAEDKHRAEAAAVEKKNSELAALGERP
jgi:hypothetical protein